MRALTVIGPYRGLTGHDHHVREFVRALVRAGISVHLRDLPLWSPRKLPPALIEPWFDTLFEPVPSRVALHFCMPHQVYPVARQRNVNFTMFEGTPAPAPWVRHSLQHDLVIVPSESSGAAWRAGGMPAERIRICPLGIAPALFGGIHEPLPPMAVRGKPLADLRVRFLNVSEIRHRKNLMGLLRAWTMATTASDDAVLILKLSGSSDAVRAFEEEASRLPGEAAPIHLDYNVYSDSQMAALYAAATHYLSLSFGEGWDQPAMEAAASGLKLIVPRHSAYPAYLDDSCATFISSVETAANLPASDDAAPLFENVRWWKPNEREAADHIRAAIDGRDSGAGTARERILTRFTWDQAAARLIEILSELDRPRRRFWPFRS